MGNVVLKVDNLEKSFGSLKVLKGVSFEVKRGEVLAIIGSSGGGKSTLLRCLTFLERANAGSIEIDGDKIIEDIKYTEKKRGKNNEPIEKHKSVYPSDKILRKKALKIGLVFQSFNLFPHLSVLDNLILAPVKVQNLSVIDAKEKAKAMLAKVGLAEKASSYPCDLSGGQAQRVAIARALMLDPDLLCFDEPTSALDPELTGEVLKVIKGLKNDDTTMIIVTHEIMFARHVADNVIFLDEGVIEEYGTAEEVLDNPKSERTKSFMHALLTNDDIY